jgi:hypothetical protein
MDPLLLSLIKDGGRGGAGNMVPKPRCGSHGFLFHELVAAPS